MTTIFKCICVYFSILNDYLQPPIFNFQCTHSIFPYLYLKDKSSLTEHIATFIYHTCNLLSKIKTSKFDTISCILSLYIEVILLDKKSGFHLDFALLSHPLKSIISAIPPLFISLILNSFRSSKSNTSFCGTDIACIVSTARMVISANDISVTWYNLSTTLIYLICVILSIIIITSVSTASPNLVSLYSFWTNLSIHVPRGESA